MGLLRMAARTAVVAGTATAVSGRVANKQQQKYANQAAEQEAQQQAAAPPPAAPAPAAPAEDDQMAQLQKLAQGTEMVTRILALQAKPTPADAADALALAICHCWRAPMIARMAEAEAMAAEQRRKYKAKLKAAT